MAIKDIQAKAMQGYNKSLDVGKGVYKASEPYRAHSKSVIAAAKGNLFEFPVFISSSVQLDYATATTSLLEQVYASYLQSALSLNPIVDESLVRNKTPFAKFQSDTNRYVEYTEMDYAHDAVHNEIVMENGDSLEFSIMSIEDADGRVIVEQYNKRPLSEFDHFFQEAKDRDNVDDDWDDYNDPEHEHIRYIETKKHNIATEKNASEQSEETKRHNEASEKETNRHNQISEDETKTHNAATEKETKRHNTATEINTYIANAETQRHNKASETLSLIANAETQRHNRKGEQETERHNKASEKHADDQAKLEKQKFRHTMAKDRLSEDRATRQERRDEIDANFKHAVKSPEMLDETKIKKLNTMKPLMMSVQFNIQDKNGTISAPVNYVVAVKTFNRIIDADTLPEVVEYPLKEMNKIARKAKWRAGELKFFRDIVFKVKQKKQTAIDSRDPKRKWYRRLYELAHMTGDAPTKAAIKGKNITWSVIKSQIEDDFDYGVIPNAAMVISNNDVINIKSRTGIDLLNGGTATKFCKELFLISLVVIDTDAESIKILLPDNHDDYEVHSLASVNKQLAELSTAGSKTRDIFKLLG